MHKAYKFLYFKQKRLPRPYLDSEAAGSFIE